MFSAPLGTGKDSIPGTKQLPMASSENCTPLWEQETKAPSGALWDHRSHAGRLCGGSAREDKRGRSHCKAEVVTPFSAIK